MNGTAAPAGGQSRIGFALGTLGFVLPIFGGGNWFFFFEPSGALWSLAAVTAGVSFLVWRSSPSRPDPDLWASLFLGIYVVVWVGNLLVRPAGGRAWLEAPAWFAALLAHQVTLRRRIESRLLAFGLIGLILGTSVTALYGQYQYWIVFPDLGPRMHTATGLFPFLGVNANFYSANCYAPFLAAVIVLIVGSLVTGAQRRIRWLCGVLLPLFFLTLWQTESRATAILLAITLAVVAGSRAFRPRASIGAALALAGAGAVALSSLWSLRDLVTVGALGRLQIWLGALAMISDHWAWGIGPGRFAEFFPRYQATAYFTRYPHSGLLEILAESGPLAAFGFTGFLVLSLRGRWSDLEGIHGRKDFGIYTFAAACLLLSHAMVDIDWHAPANFMLALLLLAVPAADRVTR